MLSPHHLRPMLSASRVHDWARALSSFTSLARAVASSIRFLASKHSSQPNTPLRRAVRGPCAGRGGQPICSHVTSAEMKLTRLSILTIGLDTGSRRQVGIPQRRETWSLRIPRKVASGCVPPPDRRLLLQVAPRRQVARRQTVHGEGRTYVASPPRQGGRF